MLMNLQVKPGSEQRISSPFTVNVTLLISEPIPVPTHLKYASFRVHISKSRRGSLPMYSSSSADAKRLATSGRISRRASISMPTGLPDTAHTAIFPLWLRLNSMPSVVGLPCSFCRISPRRGIDPEPRPLRRGKDGRRRYAAFAYPPAAYGLSRVAYFRPPRAATR